jgi:hypothetical protein
MPPGVRLVAVHEPHPPRRSVVAVTRPARSRGADALIAALREEAAAITR